MRTIILLMVMMWWPFSAMADGKLVRLYAPDVLTTSGLLRHILPRFSLKTQVRVELVNGADAAQIVLGTDGDALFQSAADGTVWHVLNTAPDHAHASRLEAWLKSDVGQRTILGFAPEGKPVFVPALAATQTAEVLTVDGDAALGHDVSVSKCGRCHAADENGRLSDIGSTPSFFMLRSLPDWQDRFSAFFALNPHPSFTQVKDVTAPFPINRPPPIVPVELTLHEVEAIVAYVATLRAADLGAPLKHQ